MAALLCICFPCAARAQLDPELDKPYLLQVVVHVAENRFLTPIFQEQLQGSLRDQLQLALGPLAKVEVVTTHPLLGEIEAKGLETGLDGWERISGVKTHFVLVDFAAGIYSVKARQYDGMTGIVSPGVRQAQTVDRALVAQAAAHLVLQDFGLVGTVIEAGKEVRLAIKGGKLAANLERWVKPGEVFAISRITMEGDKLRGRRVPWALLEVRSAPQGGVCRCRLRYRYQEDDLRDVPGVLGYRCLKITTTSGPLKLQFIDDEQFSPLVGLQVHVLKPDGTKAAELTTNRGGLLVTRDSYQHFVVARVLSGAKVRAEFPVEITGDRIVTCRLKIQAGGEALAPLELRKDQWLRRILDNLRLASERAALLNSQLKTNSMDKTLEAARAGLKTMASEVDHLALEHDDIARQARAKEAELDLRQGEQALEALRKKKQELERFITRIVEVQKEASSETTLGLFKMLERARLFELEADFDQAIALYEKVLQASPNQPNVKEHLVKLKIDWTLKDPKHAAARAFLVKVWPRLEVPELKKNLDMARESLAVCRGAQDRLTPLKVIQANVVHAANLQKQLDTLKRQNSVDNPAQAKDMARVIDGLRRLHEEATALAGKKKE